MDCLAVMVLGAPAKFMSWPLQFFQTRLSRVDPRGSLWPTRPLCWPLTCLIPVLDDCDFSWRDSLSPSPFSPY